MPITYEIESVDCTIELYGEFNDYEEEFTVIIQPETTIALFANSVCRVLRDSISDALRESEETIYYSVERDDDPPQVQVQGEVSDSVPLVTLGELIGEGVNRAEGVLEDGNHVDNADLKVGMATTLDLFDSEYYDYHGDY